MKVTQGHRVHAADQEQLPDDAEDPNDDLEPIAEGEEDEDDEEHSGEALDEHVDDDNVIDEEDPNEDAVEDEDPNEAFYTAVTEFNEVLSVTAKRLQDFTRGRGWTDRPAAAASSKSASYSGPVRGAPKKRGRGRGRGERPKAPPGSSQPTSSFDQPRRFALSAPPAPRPAFPSGTTFKPYQRYTKKPTAVTYDANPTTRESC